ncbi:MAG: hypothetical protein AAF387_18820 [Pseudomonadota bacterium]
MVDALEKRPDAINFYIGHELEHIDQKHLTWGRFLFSARLARIGATSSPHCDPRRAMMSCLTNRLVRHLDSDRMPWRMSAQSQGGFVHTLAAPIGAQSGLIRFEQ